MAYTLDQLAADCHEALEKDPGTGGRETVRRCVARACTDAEFVRTHLGADNHAERTVLYEDPQLRFCILGHVYTGAKSSKPHDHGPSWAIYGQADGITEMTDWRVVAPPRDAVPGRVEAARTYRLEPGQAHLYNEGDVHSPQRAGATRLIRIEGVNLDGVERAYYERAC